MLSIRLLMSYLASSLCASVVACIPPGTLDRCEGCPGACDAGLCELATLDGAVGAIAASSAGVYACADDGAASHFFRVTLAGERTAIGAAEGSCVRVVVAEPFVYFGTRDADGGVYRSDLLGGGLHLESAVPWLHDFTVDGEMITFTAAQLSTPVSADPGTGVRSTMGSLEQAGTEAGPVAMLADGRLLWGIPSTREAFITSLDGRSGGAVFNAPRDAQAPATAPFLVAADASGAVLADGARVWSLPTDAVRAPQVLEVGVREARGIALTDGEVIVAEGDRIRSISRTQPRQSHTVAPVQVSCVAAAEGRVFVGRGSRVVEVRR